MAAEELVVKALPEGFSRTNDKLETTDEKFEEVSGSMKNQPAYYPRYQTNLVGHFQQSLQVSQLQRQDSYHKFRFSARLYQA